MRLVNLDLQVANLEHRKKLVAVADFVVGIVGNVVVGGVVVVGVGVGVGAAAAAAAVQLAKKRGSLIAYWFYLF